MDELSDFQELKNSYLDNPIPMTEWEANPYLDEDGTCDHVSAGSWYDPDAEVSVCLACDTVVDDIDPPDDDDIIKGMKEDQL